MVGDCIFTTQVFDYCYMILETNSSILLGRDLPVVIKIHCVFYKVETILRVSRWR
jgi:hypothetical protein